MGTAIIPGWPGRRTGPPPAPRGAAGPRLALSLCAPLAILSAVRREPRAAFFAARNARRPVAESGHGWAAVSKEKRITHVARVGIGEDVHRLEPGGPLRLGGIEIPHDRGLLGHSDADVLLHAVTDALLGAAALGDIGRLFPDTDPVNAGRDSADMLRLAWQQIAAAGYRLSNLDCVVHAQRPPLAPHAGRIQARIAAILETEPERIGFKAKTGEGIGEVGREEAIVARCVALLAPAEHVSGRTPGDT